MLPLQRLILKSDMRLKHSPVYLLTIGLLGTVPAIGAISKRSCFKRNGFVQRPFESLIYLIFVEVILLQERFNFSISKKCK